MPSSFTYLVAYLMILLGSSSFVVFLQVFDPLCSASPFLFNAVDELLAIESVHHCFEG